MAINHEKAKKYADAECADCAGTGVALARENGELVEKYCHCVKGNWADSQAEAAAEDNIQE